jgi:hypothetical protein
MPGESDLAFERRRVASSARRRSRDVVCLVRRRRCMALAPVQRKEAGARDGVLITDKCRGPRGDGLSLRLLTGERQY